MGASELYILEVLFQWLEWPFLEELILEFSIRLKIIDKAWKDGCLLTFHQH